MFLPNLARALAYVLSIGFLLFGPAWAAPSADPARQALGARDGWASVPTAALPHGTVGGSRATPERTHLVTNRRELLAALAYPDPTPKLIRVRGVIDLNVDDNLRPLSCRDYHRPDPATGEMYSLHAFLFMHDPAGPIPVPMGGQEEARLASAAAQAARIQVRVPPNTTVYGEDGATLVGAALEIVGDDSGDPTPMNVIVRNLTFLDTHDCFPEWSPDDGPTGNWNSAYDSISVRHATHVWIDHNRFADERTRDELQPEYFGRHFQVHDGLVDVTHGSDYVTVSWNVFAHHDKVMLIGNSDSARSDRGRLRVTVHHNLFDDTGQRTPRVRFGQVHVYGNVYRASPGAAFRSAWGVGLESSIYAESNYFDLPERITPEQVVDIKKGTRLTLRDNCWRRAGRCQPLPAPAGLTSVDWTPELYGKASGPGTAEAAAEKVFDEGGPGRTPVP